MKREKYTPVTGKTYRNIGGGSYRCIKSSYEPTKAIMKNVASGWTFTAHGCGIYEDGSIDWDYSTGGRFEEVTK